MDVSKHGQGTTSVKVHHQPGGASSFSLGGNYYGEDNAKPKQQQQRANNNIFGNDEEDKEQEQQRQQQNNVAAGQRQTPNAQNNTNKNMDGVAETFDVFGNKVGGTSVKVHAPPGGHSSITF